MLDYTIGLAEEGVTLPYDPVFDDIRSNHGFVDTLGRPDLAREMYECAQSVSMRRLLMRLAHSEAKVFSIGCDLGGRLMPGDSGCHHIAGGYVHVLSAAYSQYWLGEYEQYGEAVANMLEGRSSGHEWELELALTPVRFNLDHFRKVTGSITVWFHAYGDAEDVATRSRDVCIANLGDCLLDADCVAHVC